MKSIIFNQHQVNHALKNEEGVFRVVIKPYPILSADKSYWEFKGIRWAGENSSYARKFGDNARPEIPELAHYQVGETIFVKEAWFESGTWGQTHPEDDEYKVWHPRGYQQKAHIHYAANGLPSIRGENSWNLEKPYCDSFIPDQDSDFWRKKPSIHMLQWASRLTLRIKSVKVERLADISEEDAVKEGIMNSGGFMDEKGVVTLRSDIDGFRDYWNATHKKPEEKFEASPWVWCFEYEVVR